MAALPISNSNEFDERQHAMTISSSQATNIVSPIGCNTNNRWFRGNLHENNENDDDVNLSMITAPSMSSNLKSVISNDNERSDAVDCLRKKVIKRLIDVTSPTSESKQKMFKKLAQNQDDTRVVIEMAIEMEASVGDTTKMLMNNCL